MHVGYFVRRFKDLGCFDLADENALQWIRCYWQFYAAWRVLERLRLYAESTTCGNTVRMVLCSLNHGPRVPNISFLKHFWRLAWAACFPAITWPCCLLSRAGMFCTWRHIICVQWSRSASNEAFWRWVYWKCLIFSEELFVALVC